MSSRQKTPSTRPMRNTKRRQTSQSHKTTRAVGSNNSSSSISDKMQALKSLIPQNDNDINYEVKPDQLYQDTADYIVLLKTQVLLLQSLVDFYGHPQNAV